MEIKPIEVTVRELTEGYEDNAEGGVVAYGGKLDVRPPYQREFIYGEKDRDKVIDTIKKNFPLNVMYWADKGNNTYEIIDGQQRTISVCQYVNGDFAFDFKYFHNLTDTEKEQILNYKLTIYVCTGTPEQKLQWFETINIAGKQLNAQELRNASYSGPFVTDAKRYFSKENGAAYQISKDILTGSPKRQDLLQTALDWMCNKEGFKEIWGYMAMHQQDANANLLWNYFREVVNWVETTFYVAKRKKILQNQKWGVWYEKNKGKVIDKNALDARIDKLLKDGEVENKRGIIPYLFTDDEQQLGLRAFSEDIKEAVYAEQDGICPICGEHFDLSAMEADHIVPWRKGGKTVKENCQMLCMPCNRKKGGK